MTLDEIELRKKNLEHQETPEAASSFSVEKGGERKAEEGIPIPPEQEARGVWGVKPPPASAPPAMVKEPVAATVEKILEENLDELYLSLPADKQQQFKVKGEETTNKITQLLREAKATFKKIFRLIFAWLKIIPGVNRFFIEQEAKIKTDKIIKLNF
jgi:hypothetical protein